MTIQTPGKKLKHIRKTLKLKQSDITGGQITRNLISIMENDKAAITQPVAKILCDNINNYCLTHEIDFHITPQELTESTYDQGNRLASNFLSELVTYQSSSSEGFYKLIEDIEMQIPTIEDATMKVDLFESISTKYRADYDYTNTYKYLLKAYTFSDPKIDLQKHYDLLLSLGACSSTLTRYQEGLNYNKLALAIPGDMPKDMVYKFHSNIALDYQSLGDYDLALEYVNKSEDLLELDNNQIFKLEMIKANCLLENDRHKESLDILNGMLGETDFNRLVLIYVTILETYIKIKDHDAITKYSDICLKLLDQFDSESDLKRQSSIYLSVGQGLALKGQISEACEFITRSIHIAIDYAYSEKIEAGIEALYKLSINHPEYMTILRDLLLKLLDKKLVSINNLSVLKTMQYFNQINDSESISLLLKACINQEAKF